MRNAKLVGVSSTSEAARVVQEKQDEHAVALGHEKSADLFDLVVLMRNIQDIEENYTRFISISKKDHDRTGNDKTSILFYFKKNEPGTLYHALKIFSKRNINLTKIESRPSKKELGDYIFFLEFEGHRADEKIHDSIEELQEITAFVKLLGSYPKKY